jgi:large subunit ribosomal protein L28
MPAGQLDMNDGIAYDSLVSVPAAQVPGVDRVRPGDPAAGARPLTPWRGRAMVRTPEEVDAMAQVCMVTGKRPAAGMNVSHSHVRTHRRLIPNLRSKRYWVPNENRWVHLRVSTQGMRIIDKLGIEAVLVDMRARGIKV